MNHAEGAMDLEGKIQGKRWGGTRVKRALGILLVLYFIVIMLTSPAQSIEAARRALLLCGNALIPSLFPFFVFSSLLIQFGFARVLAKPMAHIMHPLFGVSGSGALCFVLGILSGYPLGASCVCDLYREGGITKQEAEKLLAFCNNSGPLFIIGSVGTAMYFNQTIGIMLYIVHILSAVSVGILLGCFGRKKSGGQTAPPRSTITAKPLGVILKDAVVGAVNNMLLVCGFTILFAVIIASVTNYLPSGVGAVLGSGFLEISTGVQNASTAVLGLTERLVLTSAILGFAGLSVHFQVMGIVSKTDLGMQSYWLGKTLQAVIAAAFMAVALHNFPLDVSAVSYYMYPIRPSELIDFHTALKLSLLYIGSASFIILLLWVFEKIWAWQERTKNKRG